MQLELQTAERLLTFAFNKRTRLANEIKTTGEILQTNVSQEMKSMYEERLNELAFQYISGFRAKIDHHSQLLEIRQSLPNREWHQIKDAYKIWRKDGSLLQTELNFFQRILGGGLFILGASALGAGGIMGFFVSFWKFAPFLENTFLWAVCCLFAGSFLMYRSIPYYVAIIVETRIKHQRINNYSESKVDI